MAVLSELQSTAQRPRQGEALQSRLSNRIILDIREILIFSEIRIKVVSKINPGNVGLSGLYKM
jgi:hypothetical protein